MQVRSLGGEDPREEEMASHCSILTWRIPWTEEPGGLQNMGSQSQTRLRGLNTHTHTHSHTHPHTHTLTHTHSHTHSCTHTLTCDAPSLCRGQAGAVFPYLFPPPGPFIPLGLCPRPPCQPGLCWRHHPLGSARVPTLAPLLTALSPPASLLTPLGTCAPTLHIPWSFLLHQPAMLETCLHWTSRPSCCGPGQRLPAGSAWQPLQCCPVSWAGAPDPRGRRVLCGRLQAPVLWGHRKPTALPAPGCRLLAGQSPDVSGPHHPAVCFPFSEPLVSTAAVTSPVC